MRAVAAGLGVVLLLVSCGYDSVPFRSCADAREAGAAPLHRGDPGYSRALDGDGDGVACEGA